jgi:glycine reductase
MADQLRVAHFINQFFGGIGGEDKANVPVEVREGPVGPGRPLQELLDDRGKIVVTIISGDNYFSEQREQALKAVTQALTEAQPHVVVAGPAFDAGRYGLACGAVCQAAQEMGIPAVTAMHPENPGAIAFRRDAVIIPTGATPAEMQEILCRLRDLAVKLGNGEQLGPAEDEGYLSRGMRKLAWREEPGYLRAVNLLAKKLRGEPFQSEVPFEPPEQVPPASPIADSSRASVALISTGGLIPKGNPDRQSSGNADRYFSYSVEGLPMLTPDDWEAYHGGYYNQIASENPNYILPLRQMRQFEAEGVVGRVFPRIFTLPGVSTPVAKSQRLGREIASELTEAGVDGAILVAT